MINALAIEKSFGVGNYILVDSTVELRNHLLLAGYKVLPICNQQLKNICDIEDEYDFIIINVEKSFHDLDCNDLRQFIKKNQSIRKVGFYKTEEDFEKKHFDDVISVFKENFFILDEFGNAESAVSDLIILKKERGKNNIIPAHTLKNELGFELIKYIRANESICIIGNDAGCLAGFLIENSEVGSVKHFSNVNNYITRIEKGIKEKFIKCKKKDDYFDCIIVIDELFQISDFSSLYYLGKNLCPGGRIIFKSDSFCIDELDEYFEIEATYHLEEVPNFCEKFGGEKHIGKLNNYYVVMKSPLKDIDLFKFKEKTYLYSSPPRHLLSFENDYCNPWLVKAMVEFPTRNKNKYALERYAKKIINSYRKDSPDYGSALAIIGYQRIASGDSDTVLSLIEGYITEVEKLLKKTPHQIRWLISLSVLAGELLKIQNKRQKALEMYCKAISYDYTEFSPTIGTKVLQAYYNIAIINYCNKEIKLSQKTLNKGLEISIDLLNVEETEIIGDKNSPLVFTIFIYHDILDWTIKLFNLKNHLGKKNKLLPKLNGSTWSGMLKERMDAINNMEGMIKSRDAVIISQGEMLNERWNAINEMSKEIEAQRLLIEERWNAMQEMEQMIIERDNEILNLKNILALQKS